MIQIQAFFPLFQWFGLRACLGGLACGLLFTTALDAAAIEVTLGNLSQVYDGTPKVPDVATTPAGQTVDLTYRNLTHPQPPLSETVYSNSPDPLALSYTSVGFAVNQMNGVGNYLQLGGTARKLELCEVTMVTWAKAADYLTWAAQHPDLVTPEGYFHPVTLSLYRVTDTHGYAFLTEIKRTILVPWKPLTLPGGEPYTLNGYAFRAAFDFPTGITLPGKVLALVSFDTQNTGFEPIGGAIAGPYNVLNVAISSAIPGVGGDADPGEILKVLYNANVPAGVWSFPNTSLGSRAPLMRLRALSTQTTSAPVNADSYEVSANISDSSYAGRILGTLVIEKAAAAIAWADLTPYYDGLPKPVATTTTPTGLAVTVTYDGSTNPPSAVGVYSVAAQVIDPNYTGTAGAQLTVRPSYSSWIEGQAAAGGIPPDQMGDNDDPDGDGTSNLMEYALNLDPAVAFGFNSGALPVLPTLASGNGGWTFTYRRNLDAADLTYAIEHDADLTHPGPWPTVTGDEVILSDDGHTRVIQVTLPAAPVGQSHFYRLRCSR